jgi:hypothetical protein
MRRHTLLATLCALLLAAGLGAGCLHLPGYDEADGGGIDSGTGSDVDTDTDTDADTDTDCPGTWSAASNGLLWENPPSVEAVTLDSAEAYCGDLERCGENGWRVPTISELRTLIDGCTATAPFGACQVTDECDFSSCWDDACDGCASGSGPDGGCYWWAALAGTCEIYHSATRVAEESSWNWRLQFNDAYLYSDDGTAAAQVRCVADAP